MYHIFSDILEQTHAYYLMIKTQKDNVAVTRTFFCNVKGEMDLVIDIYDLVDPLQPICAFEDEV